MMEGQASRLSAKQVLIDEIKRSEQSLIRKKKLLEEMVWENLSQESEEYLWSLMVSNHKGYYQ